MNAQNHGADAPPTPAGDRRALWVLLGVVLVFCAPMLWHPLGLGSGDAYRDNDWFTDRLFDLLARQSLLEHGTFPLRSALVGGGFPTIAHPFDGSWAPTLLPVLLLGPALGVKLNLALLLLAGTWGTFALLRRDVGLPTPSATFGAAAFAVGGWFPSMMLVGFYPQAFYLLVPAVLALLLDPARRRSTALLAALLLFLVLQQAGNATVAVGLFLALMVLLRLAEGPGSWAPAALSIVALLCVSGGLSLGRLHGRPALALLGVAAGVGISLLPPLRARLAIGGPLALRLLAVASLACLLGAGKLMGVGFLMQHGSYAHEGLGTPSRFELPDPSAPRVAGPATDRGPAHRPRRMADEEARGAKDEDAWDSWRDALAGALWRAPNVGVARVFEAMPTPEPSPIGPPRHTAVDEYDHLGLTPPLLLLALLGLLGGPGAARWGLAGALAVAVCMGRHLALDVQFLLLGGVELLDGLFQPIKYFSFFVFLSAVALSGLGFERLRTRLPAGWPRVALAAALLAWPLIQNASAWPARFAEPAPPGFEAALPAPPVASSLPLVAQLGHPDWLALPPERREELGRHHLTRELERPSTARGYDNALRGRGTVDWYATLALPSAAVPALFTTPSGEWIANPGFRGDAWMQSGEAHIEAVTFAPNSTAVSLRITAPGRLVINQTHLDGFVVSAGEVVDADGLLAIDGLGVGRHELVLRYRPRPLLFGLAVSTLAVLGWIFAFRAARRREREAAAAAQGEGAEQESHR